MTHTPLDVTLEQVWHLTGYLFTEGLISNGVHFMSSHHTVEQTQSSLWFPLKVLSHIHGMLAVS